MNRTAALLPLVLTGCQQIPVSSLPPAQAYVDQLIQSQLIIIEVEQESLALASGMHFSPLQPARPSLSGMNSAPRASATITPDQAPTAGVSVPLPPGPQLMPGLSQVKYTGTPDALPALVSRSGTNQTLDAALDAIVPAGWKRVKSQALTQRFKEKLSWQAGDQWPHTLNKLAETHGLDITIYWASQQVIIRLRSEQPVSSGPTPSGMLAKASPPAAEITSAEQKPPRQATISNTAVLKPAEVKDAPAAKTGKEEESKDTTAVKAAAPVPRTWKADTGSTLKDTIFTWAASTECEATPGKKWTVAWVTETNYRIDAPLQFTGNWRDALNEIFLLYQRAAVPLYAGTNSAQCVLKVDDQPMQ